MALEYITTRELEGKVGGKVRIVKMSEEPDASIELTCPQCGASQTSKQTWGEPFVTGEGSNQKFNVACTKCDFKTKLLKLKKEVKKKA